MAGEFNEPKIRVLKLGGSLLDWPAFPLHLSDLIRQDAPRMANLIVVGGGAVVDAIRSFDSVHSLDPVAVHWLCVELMNSTTKLVQLLFPDSQLLDDPGLLNGWLAAASSGKKALGGSVVPPAAFVCPSAFYSPALNADALPIGWETTSDSISALLARLVAADELWLLKSTDPSSCTEAIVDSAFHAALPEEVSLRIVNLRSRA